MIKSLLHKPLTHFLIIALFSLIAYSNTFNVPFQFDDERAIANNPVIKDLRYFTSPSKAKEELEADGYYYNTLKHRYIGILSYALNYRFNGLDVKGYHIFNLTVHFLNALLVYLFALLTFRTPRLKGVSVESARYIAFFSGLLFATHPVQTQAVTYIAQRVASIATMFYLIAVIMYVKARLIYLNADGIKPKLTANPLFYYLAAIVSFILSIKTKEIAFTLPAIIFLYELIFLSQDGPGRSQNRRWLLLIPFVLLLLLVPLSLIGTDVSMDSLMDALDEETRVDKYIPRTTYLLTEFRVIVTYLRLLFLPVDQNLDYDYPIFTSFFEYQIFLSFMLLTAILASGLYLLKRSKDSSPLMRLSSFGIFWFFITLSVESSIIPLHVIFEHRMYLPSAGIFLAATSLLFITTEKMKNRWPNIGQPAAILFMAVIVGFTATTYERNKVWQSHESLWEDVVKKSPSKARGYINLGAFHIRKGNHAEALPYLVKAVKLEPSHDMAHEYLGRCYMAEGRLDEALEEFKLALKLSPSNEIYHVNIGIAYFKKGLIDDSILHLKYAVELKPSSGDAHYNLGISYGAKGMNDLAYREMKLGMRLRGR